MPRAALHCSGSVLQHRSYPTENNIKTAEQTPPISLRIPTPESSFYSPPKATYHPCLHPSLLPTYSAQHDIGGWEHGHKLVPTSLEHPRRGLLLPAFSPWSPLSPSLQDACRTPPAKDSSVVPHKPKGTGEQQWKPGSAKNLSCCSGTIDTCGSCSLKPSPGDHAAPCHGETHAHESQRVNGSNQPRLGISHLLWLSQPPPPGQGRATARQGSNKQLPLV